MLMLTDQAVTAVRHLTSQPGMSEDTGLRIASTTGDDGSQGFTLQVTDAPEPGDQVVDAQGTKVMMDSSAAEQLDDKALDAEISEQGEVQFMLGMQPES
ncbi:Fe-S cluster assembly protein HesB [Actinobacteria bacterium YIM 96077]|uniref:Fe-S cluster assembly protein HesB n=1 Tax=Phytoactinopolyspora halophila TaxID=1981511 RepID=A0A329QE25_9ACTN|nr:Fe-S cluster assembly protein HesB [Phytoactinopolyspora halophila]AYY13731.1 Fe-S cluster assembly protein HesB [Actinobacteria bacterium YIM 96077]RAW09462.1 Fe-S cluster assembly protein HesB [Phytoactinopolyspora halophila]